MKKSEKKLFFSLTYEFLEVYMRIQMLRSPATIESYRDALTVFRRYLRDELHMRVDSFGFADCTRDLVMGFMEHLSAVGNKPGTRNQRLAAIKSYLWFAAEKDMALQSVAISVGRVKSCRNPKKEKPILDEQAITLLLDAPPNTRIGMRDRTILILLYDSAARLDEILSLRKADLFLSTGSPCIRVVGKGQKERVIGLTERTSTHLKQYLSVFHTKDTEEKTFCFILLLEEKQERCLKQMLNAFSKSMRRRYVKPIPIYRNVYILICFAEPVQLAYIVMVWIYLLFLDFWDTRSWKQRGSMLHLLLK